MKSSASEWTANMKITNVFLRYTAFSFITCFCLSLPKIQNLIQENLMTMVKICDTLLYLRIKQLIVVLSSYCNTLSTSTEWCIHFTP